MRPAEYLSELIALAAFLSSIAIWLIVIA